MIESICVYASSSEVLDDVYRGHASSLGREIARNDWTLVYGGARIGLMGVAAEAARKNGGRVIGVIPEHISDKGIAFEDADELIVTSDLRSRKAEMERRADAFIALPGGFGTLEELMEIITLKQLDRHRKGIVILNIDGFYDPLISMFEKLISLRFARETYRELYSVCSDTETALAYLREYRYTPRGNKWDT